MYRPDAGRHNSALAGVHRCFGAPLVQLQGGIALENLLTRLPNLRPADSADSDHRVSRIFSEVQLSFDPRPPSGDRTS